ncbi:MAG: M48 family metallopeptidase [Acidimicrobiia bacterium]|nr:M48 family metallopeptidase [Acidimicrobiia bacterium]
MTAPAPAPGPDSTADRRSPQRHPAELRLLVVGIVVTAVLAPVLADTAIDAVGAWWAGAIAAAIVGLYVARGMLNASERANSVLITRDQFPEIHGRIVAMSEAFGLRRPPDAYVVQAGGVLNAFASRHHRTDFIRINADVLEVGSFGLGPRPRDPDALDFIIAHEIGHVAAGHVGFWYTVASNLVSLVPILGHSLSRAKEYTADNYGHAAVPDNLTGMVLLSGGKYLYPEIDPGQFVERARTDRGVFLWLTNALSSHPVMTKRIAALADRSRPGRIF